MHSKKIILLVSLLSLLVSASSVSAAKWYDDYRKAQEAAKEADWKTAIMLFKRAIKAEPEAARKKKRGFSSIIYIPYFKLGMAYLKKGDYQNARNYCLQAKEMGAAEQAAVNQCLAMTAKFLKTVEPPPTQTPAPSTPTPASQKGIPPRIQLFSQIPAETTDDSIELYGVVEDEDGIQALNIISDNLGFIRIMRIPGSQQKRQEFESVKVLDSGQSTITIEAIDMRGEVARQEFSIVRTSVPSVASAQTPTPTLVPTPTSIPTPIPLSPTPTPLPPTPTPQLPTPTPTPTPSKIEQLLKQADTYFDERWFLTPEETNAFDVYQEVLEIDPTNRHARERLREMMRMYKAWGDANDQQAKYTKAKTFYQRYLNIAQYLVEDLGDQSITLEFQEVQKQLQALEATPTPSPTPTHSPTPTRQTPTPTLVPTPTSIPTPIPTPTPISPPTAIPTPMPTSGPDTHPSIVITSEIPEETTEAMLEVRGFATDDHGIQDVKVNVQHAGGSKGLAVGVPSQRNQEQFSAEVALNNGQNTITVEAIDTRGQTEKKTFTVVRTSPPTPQPPSTGTVADSIQRPGNVYAVIIGIGEYKDERIPDLNYTVNDAQGLYDVLIDPDYGGIPEDHIRLLLDEKATDRNIKRNIGQWLRRQAKEEDTVIIYYSGHGAPEEGDTYWVTHNADIDDLFATALNNNDIAQMLEDIESERVITFLDSCYSEATIKRTKQTRSIQTEIPWEKFSGKGRVAISASDGKQLSLELHEYQHGVFTYYLLEGLKGKADENHDAVIDVDEIWDYVKYQVKDTAKKAGNPQNPVLQGSLSAGIPVTFNLPLLRQKKEEQQSAQKLEQLKDLFTQGHISPKHYNCSHKILKSGGYNIWIDSLLAGDIDPEVFSESFECR